VPRLKQQYREQASLATTAQIHELAGSVGLHRSENPKLHNLTLSSRDPPSTSWQSCGNAIRIAFRRVRVGRRRAALMAP